MGRKYKRKLGARRYKDYEDANIETALEKIVDHDWSVRRASIKYKIPYGTLHNRFHGRHFQTVGRPTLFTYNEEKLLIKAAVTCGDWGFPLSKTDLQWISKNYADGLGRRLPNTKDNKPGIDWVDSLLQRHKGEVTNRIAANIKRSRADISKNTIKQYFDHLKITTDGIPPSNIFNFDETNCADDPGKKKKLYRRGIKYPEQICNFTKSAISVMFCVSASGVLLPPYIIYKSERMWNTWTTNGPKGKPCCDSRCCKAGSRYNRTSHGWMEATTFTDWFMTCLLPHAKNLDGPKVVIGDNLSAHFTQDVFNACEENDILFTCMPPNSTHLCQPLDVCFFRPLKIAWRDTLLQWKYRNPNITTLQKDEFPNLLKKALDAMDKKTLKGEEVDEGAIKKNILSSFEATGIVPHNPQRVLQKLPDCEEDSAIEENLNSSVISLLKRQRFSEASTRTVRRKRKINVEPGRSITGSAEKEDENFSTIPSDEENDVVSVAEDEETEVDSTITENNTYEIGDFAEVILVAENTGYCKNYIGQIIDIIDDDTFMISFFRKRIGKKSIYFVFPDIKDDSAIKKSELISHIKKYSVTRGRYTFTGIDLDKFE